MNKKIPSSLAKSLPSALITPLPSSLKGMAKIGSLKGIPSTDIFGSRLAKMPFFNNHEFISVLEPLNRITKILEPVGKTLARVGKKIEMERKFSEVAMKNGIIPHRTYLTHLDEVLTHERDLWNDYISGNLADITKAFCSSYPETQLEPRRKEVFCEILNAFDNELYYLVCRLCVLEIEGLASDIFTKKGNWRYKEWQKLVKDNAAQRAGEIPLSHAFFMLEYEIIKKFSCKVFETKKFDQIDGEHKFEYLFNRHFHAHGYIFKPTQLDALNALALLHNFTIFFSFLHELDFEN